VERDDGLVAERKHLVEQPRRNGSLDPLVDIFSTLHLALLELHSHPSKLTLLLDLAGSDGGLDGLEGLPVAVADGVPPVADHKLPEARVGVAEERRDAVRDVELVLDHVPAILEPEALDDEVNDLGRDAALGVEELRRHVVDDADLGVEVGPLLDYPQPVRNLLERGRLRDLGAHQVRVLVAQQRLPLAAEDLARVVAPVELAGDLATDGAHLALADVAALLVHLEQSA
jgi:hypothetical protein